MLQQKGKIKILVLAKDDNRLEGHAFSEYLSLPECYDKRLVVMETMYDDMSVALLNSKSSVTKKKLYIWKKWLKLFYFVKYGVIKRNRQENHLRLFFGEEYTLFSAKWILSKQPNFNPDIITIHWTSGFLTSSIIKDLHKRTNALIAFVGVDEAHMTAGCHYPVDCEEYKRVCSNCPIFVKGKHLVSDMMYRKIKNLRNVPFVVLGVPYFCKRASESSVLKHSLGNFPYIKIPKVTLYESNDARKRFNISNDSFVVLFAAAKLDESRKGMTYALEALCKVSRKIPNLVLLLPGNISNRQCIEGVNIISPGYLNKDDLFKAFCASDCFLSTTIADTGPMMVNFSISLGTPVISFDVGVAHNLIIHKKNGYIANMKDVEDLSNGILFLSGLSDVEKKQMKMCCTEVIEKWRRKETAYEQLAKFYINEYSMNMK